MDKWYSFQNDQSYFIKYDLNDDWVETGFGDTADSLSGLFKTTQEHFKQPIVRKNDYEKFRDLSFTWQHDHRFTSDLEKIAMHPAYQEIIGMGEKALPYIIDSMQKKPHHWFAALKAITGVDPVDDDDMGNMFEMTNAWLNWYEKRYSNYGYKVYPAHVSKIEHR